jgi:hypothetical protein
MSKTKAPIGRPSDFSQELADEICYRIANGEGLVKICKDEHIPARSTVMRWIFKIPEFQDKYTLAREQQADFYFEEILEIADGSENDSYIDEKGNQRVDHENINRSRLRVDTRKWVIARLAPKKYGDRVEFDAEDKNWTVNGIPVKTK